MTAKKHSQDFATGQRRLEEIDQRLGALMGKAGRGAFGGGGFFAGLGSLIEQLGKLAEQAQESGGVTTKTGEFKLGPNQRVKGVYGFSLRTGLGEQGVKIEPFGNIRKDDALGKVVVQEIREPMVDVFDEPQHLQIVAEVPGITQHDVQLELQDDVLILVAEKGEMRYRKEVLLPASYSPDQMSYSCRNGILEIRLVKSEQGA